MSDKNIEIIKEIQKTGKVPTGTKMTHEIQGFSAEWTDNDALNKQWEHDQSILNTPKVGDWPVAPMPCDPLPNYPGNMNYGWICPKCGRVLAPHMDSCPYCSGATTINITY